MPLHVVSQNPYVHRIHNIWSVFFFFFFASWITWFIHEFEPFIRLYRSTAFMLYDHRAFLKGMVTTGACSIWYCSISTRPHLPPEISLRLRTPMGMGMLYCCLLVYLCKPVILIIQCCCKACKRAAISLTALQFDCWKSNMLHKWFPAWQNILQLL